MEEKIVFCKGGGCTAKLGPGVLDYVLKKIPKKKDDRLLVGFESSDDAAVYQLTDDLAIVQTLDFFPPMVEDPYLFGQIAAANALSDIYAMGWRCEDRIEYRLFSRKNGFKYIGTDLTRRESEKVAEAGGVLAGGHSIADQDVKYGLSVTGTIHPKKVFTNNTVKMEDVLILTKPLELGLLQLLPE